jgi:hypothetical protein
VLHVKQEYNVSMMKSLLRWEVLSFGALGIAIPLLAGLITMIDPALIRGNAGSILFALSTPGFFAGAPLAVSTPVALQGPMLIVSNGIAYALIGLILGKLIRLFIEPYRQ